MATAHDVAAYILQRQPSMSAMKLQKLLYYAQAWSLVWDGRELFPERIEAWANGPVVRDVYVLHRGQFEVRKWPWGNPTSLGPRERQTVNAVLEYYGSKDAEWLSDLTHREDPWLNARKGMQPGERGAREITHSMMRTYYSQL